MVKSYDLHRTPHHVILVEMLSKYEDGELSREEADALRHYAVQASVVSKLVIDNLKNK